MKVEIELVFEDWQNREGKSIYYTEEGVTLTCGDFHHGTVFDGEIELDESSAADLRDALDAGFRPVFVVLLPKSE